VGCERSCCTRGTPAKFLGYPGAGGSFGFADPQAGIEYAYVTNRMGATLPFDPRDVALRLAIHQMRRALDGNPHHQNSLTI
jgi:hypothetical protein